MNFVRHCIAAALVAISGAAAAETYASYSNPNPGVAEAHIVVTEPTMLEVKAFAQVFGNGHGKPVIISKVTLNDQPVGATEVTSGNDGEIHARVPRLVRLVPGRTYVVRYTADNRNADAGATSLQVQELQQLASN